MTAVDPRRLKPLELEWTAEALGRYFLLTPPDLHHVLLGRRPHNRLGFALHLLLMRYLNFVVPSLEVVPDAVVDFVAGQLDIDPQVLGEYGLRRHTEDDHVFQIRGYLKLRAYESPQAAQLSRHLVECAMGRDDVVGLMEEAEAWLRRESILFPTIDVLRKLIGAARAKAEKRLYRRIFEQLEEAQVAAMQGLLERPRGRRGTDFSWLNEPPPKASSKAILQLTKKLDLVESVGVGEVDLSWLVRNRRRQLAALGRRYSSTALQRFGVEKRCAIMVCWLQEVQATLTDDIVAMLDVLIGRLFTRSENQMQADQTQQAPVINRCLATMRKAVRVMLDDGVSDPEVRQVAFAEVPKAKLKQAYEASGEAQRPDDYNSFDYAKKRYQHLRSFLPAVLEALPFTGNQAAEPLLRAMATLQEMNASRKRKLPADAPTDFVDESWRKVIEPEPQTLDRPMWELCLAEKIREGIRSSDLHVVGSWQHRDWTTYLLSPEDWESRRPSWFDNWYAATDPDRYLDDLQARMDEALQRAADGWADNDFASIVDGRLKLSKDDKIDVPVSAEALKQAIQDLIPRVKLTGLLPEADSWYDIRGCYSHPAKADGGSNPLLGAGFFAVLVAHACNLSLTTMADSADLPYHQLIYLSDWYFREVCNKAALVKGVNFHNSLPLTAFFGPGTAAMSDGIRFGVTGNSLPPEHHSRYFGRRRGVTIYDTTTDQYNQPNTQVISCHDREGAPALDAALRHETDLPLIEHMTDTHGYTEMVFGMFELVGMKFSPRIRDLASQVMYPMTAAQKKGPLGALLRGRRIRRDLIKRCWDDMHRVAASLKEGTVTATLLVAKFQAMDRKSGIDQAFNELGRIHKTLFILRYITDPPFRRHVQGVLNKGEAVHSLGREICYARQGIFRERDLESLLNKASCLSLVINAIVVWNTRYMMAALDHLRSTGYPVRDEDLHFLSPLIWEHINMHGTYHFEVGDAHRRQGLRPLRQTH